MTTQFGSKYPIVAMAMNRLSDVKLACAVNSAGGVPSLSGYNYYISANEWDSNWMRRDIESYKAITGTTNILLSLGVAELLDVNIQQIITDYEIKLIELIPDSRPELKVRNPELTDEDIINRIKTVRTILNGFRSTGTKVFVKVLSIDEIARHELIFDGVILKGPSGAGRFSAKTESLEQLLKDFKTAYPNQLVIVSGGVSTSKQVKYFLDNGADGIGIGTLLAVSKESKMSSETKQALVDSSSNDIKPLRQGATQNAISFTNTNTDSYNNTMGLAAGLASPTQGHVFVGKGIENVTAILTVSDIIQNLVKDL